MGRQKGRQTKWRERQDRPLVVYLVWVTLLGSQSPWSNSYAACATRTETGADILIVRYITHQTATPSPTCPPSPLVDCCLLSCVCPVSVFLLPFIMLCNTETNVGRATSAVQKSICRMHSTSQAAAADEILDEVEEESRLHFFLFVCTKEK